MTPGLSAPFPEVTSKPSRNHKVEVRRRLAPHRAEANASRQAPSTTGSGLVGVQDAARILAVSVSTLYGWVWQRRISFVKMGRAVRFDVADLREFIEDNRVRARSGRNL